MISTTRIKVLVILEPGFAGAKRLTLDLLGSLDLEKFEVTFIYSLVRSDNWYTAEISQLAKKGIRCIEVPMDRNIRPLKDIRSFLKIVREIRRWRPDIVHTHSSKAGFLGRLAAKVTSLRIRTVYTPHGMAFYESKLALVLERLAGVLTDRLIAVSASEANDILSAKVLSARKVRIIPNAVHSPDDYPRRRKRSTIGDKFVVSSSGRISGVKNALLFFQTAAEVMSSGDSVSFLWVGDFDMHDEEAEAVKALRTRDYYANKVTITGWVSDPNEYICNSDLFLMLSKHESFGYVTADAMMMSVPVIAVKSTGTSDLIKHNHTGIFVEPRCENIAEAIRRLVRDDELRQRITQDAKESIGDNFSLSRMVSRYERTYQELVSEVCEHKTFIGDGN